MLDSKASNFFDEDFIKRNNISLVKKTKLIHLKIIYGYSLSFRNVVYKIIFIKITNNKHNRFFIFNIIKILSYLVILDKSWLNRYNPWIDWISYNLDFFQSIIKNFVN